MGRWRYEGRGKTGLPPSWRVMSIKRKDDKVHIEREFEWVCGSSSNPSRSGLTLPEAHVFSIAPSSCTPVR